MLGETYSYGLDPYQRSGLGYIDPSTGAGGPDLPKEAAKQTDPDLYVKATSLIGTIGTSLSDVLLALKGKSKTDNDPVMESRIDKLLDALGAKKSFDLNSAMPWLIGGGIGIVALMFLMGTRRKRA